MLARNPNLLPLQTSKETNVVVSPRTVLSSGRLTLPLENKPGIAKRGGLEEVVTSSKGEQEGEVLRKVQSPVRKALTKDMTSERP